MARQRGFDEDDAVAAAGRLFTAHGYEGTSVDDLVAGLGVHRGSLYRTFGSKIELFHRALRTHVVGELLPWIATLHESPEPLTAATSGRGAPDVGLLLVAAVERAATDPVAAAEVTLVFDALTTAVGVDDDDLAAALAAALLGLWLRRRAGARPADVRRAAAALAALARI